MEEKSCAHNETFKFHISKFVEIPPLGMYICCTYVQGYNTRQYVRFSCASCVVGTKYSKGGEIFKRSSCTQHDQHNDGILMPYDPYFSEASVLLRLAAITLRSNTVINKNLCHL